MRVALVLLHFLLNPLANAADSCPNTLKSAQDALSCIVVSHPRLKALEPRFAEFEARESQAKAIPNPDVEANAKVSGEKKLELDIVQPIELGGKRSARVERARAENKALRLQGEQLRVEIAADAVEALARFRQLREETEILNETAIAVERITNRLKTRPTLPPDQIVSLRLFNNYLATLEFKKLSSEREVQRARKLLEFGIGRPLSISDDVMLPQMKKWPDLKKIEVDSILPIRVALSEVHSAESEVEEARSQSWPDLRIGPSFERLDESGTTSWGAKIGISLPLWNQNQGGRDLARSKLVRSNLSADAVRKQLVQEFELARNDYERATKRLEKSSTADAIGKSIRESEKLFSRGLITPAALIEMYRSSLELVEQTHLTELLTWKIWARLQFAANPASLELP